MSGGWLSVLLLSVRTSPPATFEASGIIRVVFIVGLLSSPFAAVALGRRGAGAKLSSEVSRAKSCICEHRVNPGLTRP